MDDFNVIFEYIERKNYNALKNIIDKLNIESKKESIYSSLIKSNTIDDILNVGEDNLENQIFLLDTSFKILGRSKKAYTNNEFIEKCNGEEYLLMDTIKLMKKEKCIDTIYKAKGAFFYNTSKGSGENYIFCPVRNNDITVAYISVVEERKFNKSDLDLVNTLSGVISIEFERKNLFLNTSGLQEEYYLKDLLTKKVDNIDYVQEKLKEVNFKMKKNYIIISIPYKQKFNDFRHNFAIKELIKSAKVILKNSISTYFEAFLIICLSLDSEDGVSEEIKNQFKEFLEFNKLTCGVSFVFKNLLEIQEYFKQSKYAVKLSNNKSHRINYFEDYIEEYLFLVISDFENRVEKINIKNIIHPKVIKLKNYDYSNKTELLKTLEIYLKNNRRSINAAKELNIHKSTFFYRYHKIEEILGESFENSGELFKMELSMKLLSYINKENT